MKPRTLAGLLRARADSAGDQLAIRFKAGSGWQEWTWAEYWSAAQAAARGLAQRGTRPGDHLLLVVPEVRAAVTSLFGAWALGATPTILGVPYHLTEPGGYLAQVRALAGRLGARAVILSRSLAAAVPDGDGPPCWAAEDLPDASPGSLPDPDAAPGPALIQRTSGSTAEPRGVVIGHERLMLHMECLRQALPTPGTPVAVSWLPLHHDMGLIGGLLFPFYNGFVANMVSPLDFRVRPLCWLSAMSQFQATICAAPPSAYALCISLARQAVGAGLELSAWQCAMVGAEPISPRVLRDFATAFAPVGFRANTFFAVYGLAEATVAVTFPRLLAPTRFDCIARPALERTGRAVPCQPGPHALELVGAGRPIPQTALRIVDNAGQELPERAEGEIQVRSASLMEGYYRDPEATADVFTEGWLKTGDLGYVADGELFVTGRKKDLIIRGGHNLAPAHLEEIAATVEGARPGGVAAVGVPCPRRATELVWLVVETRQPAETHDDLRGRLRKTLRDHGLNVDKVLLVPPRTLPRTSSGKLRRRALAESLSTGDLCAAGVIAGEV
jgi:acyl-CoA synthetase (AMP-forming)/AMP-acid ligase II